MIYLIRHGEIENSGFYYGQLEAKLSEKGKKTSEKVVQELASKEIDLVISSSLRRASYLAELIKIEYDICLEIDKRLDAKNYGEWAGQKKKNVRRKNYNLLSKKWFAKGKGGESYFEVANRVDSLLEELIHSDSLNIVLVSHEGIIKVMSSIINGNLAGINKSFNYGSISKYTSIFPSKLVKELNKAYSSRNIQRLFKK